MMRFFQFLALVLGMAVCADIVVNLNEVDGSYTIDGQLLQGTKTLQVKGIPNADGSNQLSVRFWFDKQGATQFTVTDGANQVLKSNEVDPNKIYILNGPTLTVDLSANQNFDFALFFRRILQNEDSTVTIRNFYANLPGSNGYKQDIGDQNKTTITTFFAPLRAGKPPIYVVNPTQVRGAANCQAKLYSGGEPGPKSLSVYLLQNVGQVNHNPMILSSNSQYVQGFIFTFATTIVLAPGCYSTVIVNNTIYDGTGMMVLSQQSGSSFLMSQDYPGRLDGIQVPEVDIALSYVMDPIVPDYNTTVFSGEIFRFITANTTSRLSIIFGFQDGAKNITLTADTYGQQFSGTGDTMNVNFNPWDSKANFLIRWDFGPTVVTTTTPGGSGGAFKMIVVLLLLCTIWKLI